MWYWFLTRTLVTTKNRDYAQRSFWTWRDDGSGVYRLRVLGVLHALTGYVYRTGS